MLKSAYSSKVFSWIGRCHQRSGSFSMAPGEVAMLQSDN
jgi:hypothetical protein